jgi:hypothetical protein
MDNQSEEELSYPFNMANPAAYFQKSSSDDEFWSEFVTKQAQLGYSAISFDIGACRNVTIENLERITERLHDLGYKTTVVIDRWTRKQWIKKTPYGTVNRMSGARKYIPIRALYVAAKLEYLTNVKDAPEP